MGSVVAIVGRPNVGKSTLFNRLIGERKAIVDDMSGVTRDRHYGTGEWLDREFTVIDTGGYVHGSDDIFEAAIRSQVQIAMVEADVLLFMVDVTCGITDLEEDFARILRKSKKKVLVVVNKVDNNERLVDTHEFHRMGFKDIFPISSVSGFGTGELLDELIKHISVQEEDISNLPKIAIIGRPNVGKSSLINALLGIERNIVTDIAGTTRDSVHSLYKGFGHEFWLVDTAGVRKKAKVNEDVEFYMVMRSLRAIEDADVCMLMIDAQEGIQAQDLNLFHLCDRNGKGIVILVNKWDLVEDKQNNTTKKIIEGIKERLAPFNDVPILFISATEKQRIHKAIETAVEVYEKRKKHIPTHELNEFMLEVINQNQPPAIKGKYIKIKYVTQLKGNTRQFLFFCNLPQYVSESYKRFLENRLREQYDFSGVPLRLDFRKK